MTEEKDIQQKAIRYARKNKKQIAKKVLENYSRVEHPYSMFMAGSPGAGKSEWARNVKHVTSGEMLHIDGDDLRNELPGYTGDNSHLFQEAMSTLVSYIHDQVLDKSISFLLDGTLSSAVKARENIQRSLKRERKITVIYVYLDPLKAWEYTQSREIEEGRRITKETFIEKYIGSYQTVRTIRDEFHPDDVEVLLYSRKGENKDVSVTLILNKDQIDQCISKLYNKEELEQLL